MGYNTRAYQGVGRYAGTVHSISATTSSAAISGTISDGVFVVSIVNDGDAKCYVNSSGATATTSDEPLGVGERIDRIVDQGGKVSAITPSGSTVVKVVELTA